MGLYKNLLPDVSSNLIDVAMGRAPADLIIKNGRLVNVHTGEILPGTALAVKCGRIALVGDAGYAVGKDTVVVDADGAYLVPGLMDGHIHVESSMVTVAEFARAVLPHGTTAVFMDPHEIANVLGLEGIRLMHSEGQDLPLRVFTTVPSCVPAAPGLEDAGAVMGPAEVREAMSWEGIVGLGEMMNFPGVLANDPQVHAILRETLIANKKVTGHYALPDIGPGLQAYVAAGASSCHEATRMEEALARMRLGMYAMLREGSAWHDVKETIRAVTENRVDTGLCILCSDDTNPYTLLERGHLDHVIRRAVQEGVNPVRAIQMATINVARYFNVTADLGSISPGRFADILLVTDLARFKVEQVFVFGVMVAEGGRLTVDLPAAAYPAEAYQTVRFNSLLEEKDFVVKAPPGAKEVTIRVIEIEEAHVGTRAALLRVPVSGTQIQADIKNDLAKAAVFERHGKGKGAALGFVRGFGFTRGAVASTVAHDSHNLLIVGTNDTDMALAGNILAEHGGGMVAVAEGEVLALVELPVAGLLSDKPVEEVAAAVQKLEKAWRELGCTLVSPFMTMSLLSLPVIPQLRLTNRGLVDVSRFAVVDLFAGEGERVEIPY